MFIVSKTEHETRLKIGQMQLNFFLHRLSGENCRILQTFPEEHLGEKLALLVTRRAGEGELDIFLGYYKEDGETKAVFASLHPWMSIMLLEKKILEERIENFERQRMPREQTEQALADWPR